MWCRSFLCRNPTLHLQIEERIATVGSAFDAFGTPSLFSPIQEHHQNNKSITQMKSELVRATNHLNIGKGRCNGWIEQPEEIKSGIYMWTNKVNGKRYVGQSVNLKNRKKAFLSFTSTFNYGGDYINKARQHYNHPSDWSYIIVEYCAVEALDDREIDYIAQYGTTDREKGYNASIGGNSANGVIQTAETINKRANSNKKVIQQLDPETLEVIREWRGLIEAAEYFGLKTTSPIIKCCQGKYHQSAGYKWEYADK